MIAKFISFEKNSIFLHISYFLKSLIIIHLGIVEAFLEITFVGNLLDSAEGFLCTLIISRKLIINYNIHKCIIL